MTAIPRIRFAATGGAPAIEVPAVGQGTWRMGERANRRKQEADALVLGVDLGMTVIDTAEMYGQGGAEEVVADAIAGRRDGVFIVSKVLPGNASREGTIRACEASLKRLRTDRIDLYLLHWPGEHPFEDTLAAFRRLVETGKIVRYGVSNFDQDDMESAFGLTGGDLIASNQVLYNPMRRGIERNLLPWCRERRVVVMAYSPVEQGELAGDPALARIASRRGTRPSQIAIAWSFRGGGILTVPKSTDPVHVRENAAAGAIELTGDELAEIDKAFPRPARAIPLETA